MNTRCTWITYVNWEKVIRYYHDTVNNSEWVSTISYPLLTTEDIEEIEKTTYERVNEILSKFF